MRGEYLTEEGSELSSDMGEDKGLEGPNVTSRVGLVMPISSTTDRDCSKYCTHLAPISY